MTHKPINPHSQTVTCYVTYEKNEDAIVCINAVNGAWLGSKLLRASYGTTKYCTYFLKGIECTNPNCLYLHELGSEQDSFTKESMILGKNLFSESVHPKVAYNSDGSNVFPHICTLPQICMPSLIHYDIASRKYPPRYREISEGDESKLGNYKICTGKFGGIIAAYLDLDNTNEEAEEKEEENENTLNKENDTSGNDNDDDDNDGDSIAVETNQEESIIISTDDDDKDNDNNNDEASASTPIITNDNNINIQINDSTKLESILSPL